MEIDYTRNIAREGEEQLACILRNRSGVDSGEIDYGLRDLSSLCDLDKQEVCNTAYLLYKQICNHTGKIAKLEWINTAVEFQSGGPSEN